MEYVVAVDRYRSLTAAAAALNVSQPSLSVAITQIEQHLGVQLFVRRRGAPVSVTAGGQAVIPHAQALLAAADRLENSFRGGGGHHVRVPRVVRFGVFEDLAPSWLAPILRVARASAPQLQLVPAIGDFRSMTTGLRQGRIDLALTYDLGLDAAFQKTDLGDVAPSAFFSAADGEKGATVSLRELGDAALILFEEDLSSQHVLQLFANQGLRPRVAHRVTSLEVMRSLAANGEGVGISYTTPPSAVSYDGAGIVSVPISDPQARERLVLVRMESGSADFAVETMMQILAETGMPSIGDLVRA